MTDTKARRGPGRPTRSQAAAMDDRIIDGARDVYYRLGVSAPIEEIALALKVSKHTLYRRYANRRELLDAVVQKDIAAFRHTLELAAGANTPPLEAVRKTALAYHQIGASRDYAAFYLSLMAETVLSKDLESRFAAWARTSQAPLVERIAAAQAAGSLTAGDPAATTAILIDLMEGANNRVRLAPPMPRGEAEAIFAARWDVFLAAFAAR